MRKYALTILLLLAAPNSLAATGWEQARDLYDRGDVTTAVRKWRALAESGDMDAQMSLGQLYRYGDSVQRDDEEAVKWYVRASQQGSDVAFHNLRMMHLEERATLADLRRALSSPEVSPGEVPVAAPEATVPAEETSK